MELRIPSPEQLKTVYDMDLRESFPAAELKPLENMERMWRDGWYRPWCLFDGDDIVGDCFYGWDTPAGHCWITSASLPAAAARAWAR